MSLDNIIAPKIKIPWYDDEAEMRARLRTLQDLHDLLEARAKAPVPASLRSWVLMGRLVLDRDQFGTIVSNAPADALRFLSLAARDRFDAYGTVMPLSVAIECSASITWTHSYLPPTGAVCARCKEGWTLRTAHDLASDRTDPMHIACRRLQIVQVAYDDLLGILRSAGVEFSDPQLIPSKYHPDADWFGAPWLACETIRGRITLGVRKRVYEIRWPWVTPSSDLFKEEGVTFENNLVHAWTREKAVEYIGKIWRA